jgi:hypothetical protein
MVQTRWLWIGFLVCVLLARTAGADTYKLTDGRTVTGELLLSTATEAGVKLKTGDSDYQNVPWGSFSQEDLKTFAANKKIEPLVEPFIEVTQAEKMKKTDVGTIKHPERLERPEAHSVFGALATSGLGLVVLLALYAGNLYAAYEISIFRAQPTGLVCGVSAVAPVIGPIIFLSMPTKIPPSEPAQEVVAEAPPEGAQPAQEGVNPMHVDGAANPGGLHLAHTEAPKPALPQSITFQRGQFTFNRRFFETKFPNFFGVVRRDADRDMVLFIKAARGTFTGQRIARIAAHDLHLQVQKGAASEEVMIPFAEIQEIVLKHKDA